MFDYGKLVMVLQKKDHDLRGLASGALMGDIRLKIRGPNLLIQRPDRNFLKLHK